MSLLKWRKLAKSRSELGDKINTVRNTIIKHGLGQQTNQASFQIVFQPIAIKLDVVFSSNLKINPTKIRLLKKWKYQITVLILRMRFQA